MPTFSPPTSLLCLAVVLLLLARPTAAFGAGNIGSLSAIEGQNWRHGDIEDTLLTLLMARAAGGQKFGKLDVARVYFGNWLRDYSQAVDVGTVKYVSAEAIRLILWVLGFMTFGYGTGEFEVTYDRLGCYRPEEHIDNPKDYADNLDARQYDRRLRGPVDERRELSINPQTGLKNYIATENVGINTSAGLVRNFFGQCIQLGRKYARSRNKADLYEALRLLGTGCHCLEDYAAHSNYTELCLIELGEQNVFPHVGRQTKVTIQGSRHGPVYPIVTGTFGGTDFLYSVIGEFGDKAAQSELDQLQGLAENAQSGGNSSILHDLLSQVPSGLFGGEDEAGKADQLQANAQAAHAQIANVSPRQPEAWAKSLDEVQKTIYPILQWHDQILQAITQFIEKIPILPDLIEQIQNEINIFVFSLLAPLVLPIMEQVKTELNTGSSEIIQSSKDKQFIVFSNDHSSDPTHSMLSKDHFSNILNEPAGKVASQILKWVVPQLMECWDNERIDVNRTLNRIINGVFHHPAQKDMGDDGAADGRRLMFGVMQNWWSSKNEREKATFRDQLSRDGVQNGRNQKAGIHDTGHGCGVPLSIPGVKGIGGAVGGAAAGGLLGQITSALAGESEYDPGARPQIAPGGRVTQGNPTPGFSNFAQQAAGIGLGAVVGGFGAEVLGHAFSGSEAQTKHFQTQQYGEDGSYTQNYVQTGYNPSGGQPTYGQAAYSQTNYPGGGQREEYQRYQQEGTYGQAAYSETVISNTRPVYGGGFEQTTQVRHERPDGRWESDVTRRGEGIGGAFVAEEVYEHEKHKKHHKNRRSGEYEEEEVLEEPRRYGGETVVEEDRIYGREPGYREETVEYGSRHQARPFVEEEDVYNRNRRRPEEFVEEERITTEYGGGYGRQEFARERDDVIDRREDDYEDRRGGGYGGGDREEVVEEVFDDDRRGGYGGGREEEFVEREEREYEY